MGRRANPALVGAFVLGATVLAIVAVVMFGSGRLFRSSQTFALYFESDVNGLRVGAPVKFRGVEIGSVTDIRLSLGPLDTVQRQDPVSVRIPVLIEIDADKISGRGGAADLDNPQALSEAVQRGLRAQLGVESIVTGLLYVDLDMRPDTPAHYVLGPESPYPEIPTVPTAMEQAQMTAQKIFNALEKVNWGRLIESLTRTADGINNFVQSQQLKEGLESLREAVANLNQTATSLRHLSEKLDTEIGPLATSLRASADSADHALKQLTSTLANVQATVEPGSPLNYQLSQTLDELTSAARAVRVLADYLERNPSALVRGKYPDEAAR
jgi:paraquat-inducible protein B